MRIHRSLRKLIGHIDPAKVAGQAEYYLDGERLYRPDLERVPGLVSRDRISDCVKKIDYLERDIVKLEDKIARLEEKRALTASKLDAHLMQNFEVLDEVLDPDEIADFR